MEGKKYDNGKPLIGLVPYCSIRAIAEVLTFGAKKYGPWNWAKGMKWSRLHDACLRHLGAWSMRVEKDEESGLSHLAHAGCCLMFLIAYEILGTGEDDRWNPDDGSTAADQKVEREPGSICP